MPTYQAYLSYRIEVKAAQVVEADDPLEAARKADRQVDIGKLGDDIPGWALNRCGISWIVLGESEMLSDMVEELDENGTPVRQHEIDWDGPQVCTYDLQKPED